MLNLWKQKGAQGHYRICLRAFVLFALGTFTSVSQTGSQPTEDFDLTRLVEAVRISFRDSSEFRVRQNVTLTATDSRGHVRKTRKGSVNYLFQGFRVASQRALVGEMSISSFGELWSVVIRGLWRLAVNSDLWTTMPIETLLGPNATAIYTFQAKKTLENQSLIAELNPIRACPPFTMVHSRPYYWPDRPCGSHEFELDQDMTLRQYQFFSAGLPAEVNIKPFKRCMLISYRADVEYHKVQIADDPRPFLVPKRVVATLETNKGNLVITSDYTPEAGSPR